MMHYVDLNFFLVEGQRAELLSRFKVLLEERFQNDFFRKFSRDGKSIPVVSLNSDFTSAFIPSGDLHFSRLKEGEPDIQLLHNGRVVFTGKDNEIWKFYCKPIVCQNSLKLSHSLMNSTLCTDYHFNHNFTVCHWSKEKFSYSDLDDWKYEVAKLNPGVVKFKLTTIDENDQAVEVKTPIFLYKKDALKEVLLSNPDYVLPVDLLTKFEPNEDVDLLEYCHIFQIADGQVQAVPIDSLMIISPCVDKTVRRSDQVQVLQDAFTHLLSASGHCAEDWLKANILIRFRQWLSSKDVIAPIASLSQGSGSGKSKLAVELIKDWPGFYLVLRSDPESSGYPKNNALSRLLLALFNNIDPLDDLTRKPYLHFTTGNVLMLIARITLFYMKYWHQIVLNSIEAASKTMEYAQMSASQRAELHYRIARAACAELGSLFDANDLINCDKFLLAGDLAVVQKINATASVVPEVGPE